jgi:hypothetical protein
VGVLRVNVTGGGRCRVVARRIVVVVLTGALTALAAIGVAVTTPLGFDARDLVEVERNAQRAHAPAGQGGDHPGKGRPGEPEDPWRARVRWARRSRTV